MFSGIGGFEYGLQQSKHEFTNVGYSEIDKWAISIYTKRFPTHKNYGDATKINTKNLPDFEFLVGGFPCQAFSIAGHGNPPTRKSKSGMSSVLIFVASPKFLWFGKCLS